MSAHWIIAPKKVIGIEKLIIIIIIIIKWGEMEILKLSTNTQVKCTVFLASVRCVIGMSSA